MKKRKLLALVLAIITIISCMSFNALADNSADLDETTETKSIDQNYDVTITESKTDVTKVQISWTLSDISASVTNNKIWDTGNLKWIDNANIVNTATADAVTAEFNFTNLSSVKIGATVEFKAESGFDPTVAYTVDDDDKAFGYKTLGTANTTEENPVTTGTIKVTLTPDDDDFASLKEAETDAKYGTYTVKISTKEFCVVTVNYYDGTEDKAEKFLVEKDTEITVSDNVITIGDNPAITTSSLGFYNWFRWEGTYIRDIDNHSTITVSTDYIIDVCYD